MVQIISKQPPLPLGKFVLFFGCKNCISESIIRDNNAGE